MYPDPDGITRRDPLVMRHDGVVYPSLALEMVRLFLLLDKVEPVSAMEGDHHELDLIRVKGKHQAVTIYQPICKRANATECDEKEMAMWHEAIELYRQARWQDAHTAFQALHTPSDAKELAKRYLERITVPLEWHTSRKLGGRY